jgi:hypothetical protein
MRVEVAILLSFCILFFSLFIFSSLFDFSSFHFSLDQFNVVSTMDLGVRISSTAGLRQSSWSLPIGDRVRSDSAPAQRASTPDRAKRPAENSKERTTSEDQKQAPWNVSPASIVRLQQAWPRLPRIRCEQRCGVNQGMPS